MHVNESAGCSVTASGRPIYRPIFGIFQILASADKFFCLAPSAHILPLVRCHRLTVLSNNPIELLNKGIKMYTKKYYNDCFYIISNRKA